MSLKVSFIGLGNMGAPMAENLLKAGFALTVYDVVPAAVERLVVAGAASAPTVADAVAQANIVVTMLPGDRFVRSVYLDDGGVIAGAKSGALLIDSSTISAAAAKEVAAAATARGLDMIDAPVSGGTAGAAAGTLTFIVGGASAALERARPVLEKMGKNIFHAGDSGAGQVVKICNNMLLAIHMIGTAEALNLAEAYGLDPKVVSEIMSKSSGRNWSLEVYNPMPGTMENVPSARGYSGGFGTDLMLKDLGLAQEAALAAHAVTPLGALARDLYRRHSESGQGKLDFSSIINMLKPADHG